MDCRVTHTTSSFFVFQGYKPAKLGYIVSKADLSRVEGTEVRFEMNLSGLEWFGEKEARFCSLLGVYASSKNLWKFVEMSFKNVPFFAKSGQIWIWLKTTVYS